MLVAFWAMFGYSCFEVEVHAVRHPSSRGVFVCPPMMADAPPITAEATKGQCPEESSNHGNRKVKWFNDARASAHHARRAARTCSSTTPPVRRKASEPREGIMSSSTSTAVQGAAGANVRKV